MDGAVIGTILSYPGNIYRELRLRTIARLWPKFFNSYDDSDYETEPCEFTWTRPSLSVSTSPSVSFRQGTGMPSGVDSQRRIVTL